MSHEIKHNQEKIDHTLEEVVLRLRQGRSALVTVTDYIEDQALRPLTLYIEPNDGQVIVEIPQEAAQVPVYLHTAELKLKALLAAQGLSDIRVNFAPLNSPAFTNAIRLAQDQYFHFHLNVHPDQVHHVLVHSQAKPELVSLYGDYYQWLLEQYELESLPFPAIVKIGILEGNTFVNEDQKRVGITKDKPLMTAHSQHVQKAPNQFKLSHPARWNPASDRHQWGQTLYADAQPAGTIKQT